MWAVADEPHSSFLVRVRLAWSPSGSQIRVKVFTGLSQRSGALRGWSSTHIHSLANSWAAEHGLVQRSRAPPSCPFLLSLSLVHLHILPISACLCSSSPPLFFLPISFSLSPSVFLSSFFMSFLAFPLPLFSPLLSPLGNYMWQQGCLSGPPLGDHSHRTSNAGICYPNQGESDDDGATAPSSSLCSGVSVSPQTGAPLHWPAIAHILTYIYWPWTEVQVPGPKGSCWELESTPGGPQKRSRCLSQELSTHGQQSYEMGPITVPSSQKRELKSTGGDMTCLRSHSGHGSEWRPEPRPSSSRYTP